VSRYVACYRYIGGSVSARVGEPRHWWGRFGVDWICGLAAMVLVFSAVSAPAAAATPGGGTVSAANPSISWTGASYLAAETALPEQCPPADPGNLVCDHFALTIDIPSNFWPLHSGPAHAEPDAPDRRHRSRTGHRRRSPPDGGRADDPRRQGRQPMGIRAVGDVHVAELRPPLDGSRGLLPHRLAYRGEAGPASWRRRHGHRHGRSGVRLLRGPGGPREPRRRGGERRRARVEEEPARGQSGPRQAMVRRGQRRD